MRNDSRGCHPPPQGGDVDVGVGGGVRGLGPALDGLSVVRLPVLSLLALLVQKYT